MNEATLPDSDPQLVNAIIHDDRHVLVVYDDGVSGLLDVGPLIAQGSFFADLTDPALLRRVAIDREWNSLAWPNGADLAPEFVRETIARQHAEFLRFLETRRVAA